MKTAENTRKQTATAFSDANTAFPMGRPCVGRLFETVGRDAIRGVPIRG